WRQFLQSHPRSPFAAEATYRLGESYARRNMMGDAAEQFLKVSTQWPESPHAAESMLQLALSLRALGEPGQACTTLREIDRRYPNAPANVKRAAERELRRAPCAT